MAPTVLAETETTGKDLSFDGHSITLADDIFPTTRLPGSLKFFAFRFVNNFFETIVI